MTVRIGKPPSTRSIKAGLCCAREQMSRCRLTTGSSFRAHRCINPRRQARTLIGEALDRVPREERAFADAAIRGVAFVDAIAHPGHPWRLTMAEQKIGG